MIEKRLTCFHLEMHEQQIFNVVAILAVNIVVEAHFIYNSILGKLPKSKKQ